MASEAKSMEEQQSPSKRPRPSPLDENVGEGHDGVHSFSLMECDWIGFDLDHTLIRYQLEQISRLIFDGTMKFLAQEKNHKYDRLHIESLQYDYTWKGRGTIFDNNNGNLIYIDAQKRVVKAQHGYSVLSDDEMHAIYPEPLVEFTAEHGGRYWPLITFFEMPATNILAALVDLVEKNVPVAERSENIYADLFQDLVHSYGANFNEYDKGWYFPVLKQETDMQKEIAKYIYLRDDVKHWLKRLRTAGKRTFLVTNSKLDYVFLLCNYAFGNDWRDLFDIVVVDAKKDTFFSAQNPFLHTNPANFADSDKKVQELQLNGIYAFGNSTELHEFFRRHPPHDLSPDAMASYDPTVIYFGDHLRTDMVACKKYTSWLPGVIIEELEQFVSAEVIGALLEEYKEEKKRSGKRARTDHAWNSNAAAPAQTPYEVMRESPTWGCLFYTRSRHGVCESYWHQMVMDNAAVALHDVSTLNLLPLDYVFRYRPGTPLCYIHEPPRPERRFPLQQLGRAQAGTDVFHIINPTNDAGSVEKSHDQANGDACDCCD